MSVTPNMNITLPTPEVTTGPEWANQIVDAFDNVDAHDHTSGKGVKIPVAGLNINADLEFNDFNAIELKSTRYSNNSSVLSSTFDKNCLYFVNGNLFINNAAGTSVQLTSGNSINLSTVGTIGGDYGQPGVTASATYSNTTKTFSWTQAPTQAAKMAVGDLIVYETIAGANPITIKSTSGVTVGYDYWLPQSGPTANQLWRQNSGSTGADFVTIQGTTNQVTITHGASTITASLPSAVITPGTLRSTGNFDVNTNKFTVDATSGNTVVAGDLAVNGGDLTSSQTTFNLLNATTTTLNIGGAATAVSLGASTGTATINNPTVVGANATQNLFNTVATTLNIGGAATAVSLGAGTGTTTVNNTLAATGNISANSGTITTNQTTVNLINTTATTLNIGGAATSVTIGATTGTATLRNATVNASGDLNVTGNGRGIVPLGAIIAMTTGLTGAMAVPATGVVSNGWMRADGAAIPGGNTVSGTTPNLSNSIYLRGASTYGGTGGSNTTTLAEANLPTHTHVNTLSNNTVASSTHTHNMKHVHQWAWTELSSKLHTMSTQSTGVTTFDKNTSGSFFLLDFTSAGNQTYNLPLYMRSNIGNAYTAGVLSANSGSGDSANTGAASATTTVTLTNASIGSGTAFSNEPNYINVIYLIRVS